MNVVTLKQKIADKENIILLDVRDAEEIVQDPFFVTPPRTYLHLPIMPLLFASQEELHEKIFGALRLPETTPIVTLCQSGGRSQRACEQLQHFGWHAENLDGGILAWGKPQ